MEYLKVKRLHHEASMPVFGTKGAACFDLHADLRILQKAIGSMVVGTGLAFEVPSGCALMIYSRSGQGFKDNTRLANCVGVIDSDYRGEVLVKLTRDDGGAIEVGPGERIAQAMLIRLPEVTLVEVSELSNTERGTNGFGSTGRQSPKGQ